jgi:hypothetical protein
MCREIYTKTICKTCGDDLYDDPIVEPCEDGLRLEDHRTCKNGVQYSTAKEYIECIECEEDRERKEREEALAEAMNETLICESD